MSDMYAIKSSTLSALGDAIRNVKGEEKVLSWSGEFVDFTKEAVIYVPIVIGHKYRLSFTVNELENNMYNTFDVYICDYKYGSTQTIPVGQTKQIDFVASHSGDNIRLKNMKTFTGSYILEELDENDNVITNTYTPLEMADVINGLDTIPTEAFVLTGSCYGKFYYGGWDWFIRDYGNKITTKDITDLSCMFYSSNLEIIPFELNISGTNCEVKSFVSFSKIKSSPIIKNLIVYKLEGFFANAYHIREIPEEMISTWDWSKINSMTSAYTGSMSEMFSGCYSLRKIPIQLLENGNPVITNSYNIFYTMCKGCYTLDEIIDLPYPHYNATWTSNGFNYSFENTYRLKNLVFRTPNDMPYVVNWKNQIINLSSYTGYGSSVSYILNYNSGITADKEVKDDATYQALKNDPDWFSRDINYSRYNHDSAVATINSLPDTSAYLAANGGTNTIKFKGNAGAATDGGAINTLTEAEIAVAAAKGWTVSFT